jgi:hydroxymethylpyrimidine/phosphomethylpyrimidine kinase
MKRVITIAGSDSSAGAGIQADMKVFAQLGVYGTCAVTAVTAQNSKGVQKISRVAPRIVAAQIDSVTRDIGVDACKVGMMYSQQVVDLVADRIHRRKIPNVVLDPVIFAKDGTRLLSAKAVERLKRNLLPRTFLVAPNIPEAELLTGITIHERDDIWAAAARLVEMGAKYALIKGGHLEGEPVDYLSDGSSVLEFARARVAGDAMHGTGCVLTAAIAGQLALGASVPDAIARAKAFVTAAITGAVTLGKGKMSFYGGTNTEGAGG